jgi:transglutaminase-like putative cysteine protease
MRKLPSPLPRLLLAEVGLVVTTTFAGALVYSGFFASADYLPVLGLACLAGAGAATAAAARRCNALLTLLVAAAGFALFATYAVFGDTVENGLPTSRTVADLRHGVLGGWARMLTVAPPADTWDQLVVIPVLVVWCAVFAAVTLTIRTLSPLAPVAPPLVAFVLALLCVGNQPGEHTAATAAFLTATVALLLIRVHRTATGTVPSGPRPWRRTRPILTAGLTLTGTVLCGVLGGQALPLASGQHRFDPRDLRPPPITLADTLTPLTTLKPQLTQNPPRPLFTVRINQENAARVSQVRTAALDAFDGTTWTTTDTYRVAGSHLTPDPALTNAAPVAARIEVTDLPGPFLPTLGWPSHIAAARHNPGAIGFNTRSGVLVSTAPTLRGLRYDIEGTISSRDEELPLAPPTTSTEFARYRELPTDTPTWLKVLARQRIGTQPTPYAQLTELARYLQSRPYSLRAPPGHAYAALTRLLSDNHTDDVGSAGYAEQYAAAFAVLARALGYPARVAVGYRLHDYHDGAYAVTTSDAHAWPEVHFTGYGWVSFEPTDTSNTTDIPPPPPPDIPLVAPLRPNPPPGPPPAAQPSPAKTGTQPGFDWAGVLRGTVPLVVGIVALVPCTAALVTAEKTRRRRRRRTAGDPAARVLGAWHELIDRLAERGVTAAVSLTAQEVARHAEAALGPAAISVTAAAPLATAAVFEPSQLDQRAAERAWQLATQLHTDLYPRRVSLGRLRAAMSPRPLWLQWRDSWDRRRAWIRLELGRYR